MEITGKDASEFQDVVLEKCKALVEEDVIAVQPNQSPHIAEDLPPKGAESGVERVNKCSTSTVDAQNQENSHSKANFNGDITAESQVTSVFEENTWNIPESPSAVRSENNNSQTEKESSLQSNNSESILAKDNSCTVVDTLKEEDNCVGVSPSSPGHSMSSQSLAALNERQESDCSTKAANLMCSTLVTPQRDPSEEESSVNHEVTQSSPSHHSVIAAATPEKVPSSIAGKASPAHSEISQASPSHLPNAPSPKNQPSSHISPPTPPPTPPEMIDKHKRLQEQLRSYESQVEQLKKALSQKDNTITLYQRENALLEKEKLAFRKEKELATKEKESIVITFATKEKSLIDAKKQKESVEKQLADSRKEVKNISMKFHALNEEKSRITYMLDEKCNEVKKYQKELEKQKADYNNLEMKLKWNSVKLAQETEAKLTAERKLEEERNAPKPHEEKANEKIKVEYEATAILLKHEIENKDKTIEALTKENKQASEKINQLQETMSKEILENTSLSRELECLRQEHTAVQDSYSEEMLNSAKLRGQLEELQVLRTQHTLNEDKINTLNANLRELEDKVLDSTQDLEQLQAKEQELLSINKEMSEMIVGLQNEICLQTSKVKGVEAENEILKKEKLDFDTKYNDIESQLKQEIQQKNDERLLLTKHLSEKTKMYESVKAKLENTQGDLEAIKKKHSQVVKELQRELQKYKKLFEEKSSPSSPTKQNFCPNCELKNTSEERIASRNSRGSNNSRSDSESEARSTTSTMNRDVQGPSKQHLVERILRLQQASARQTEKIDFLENHTLSLVAELQKKSKVVQYYMMRDQAGALTSSKSDQNKSELAKYGGVMSAIYSGIKGPNQSMTLELSLEINKKLQAVLEDTLLKNITLKENLDVLGLEVDKLTRKLAQLKS